MDIWVKGTSGAVRGDNVVDDVAARAEEMILRVHKEGRTHQSTRPITDSACPYSNDSPLPRGHGDALKRGSTQHSTRRLSEYLLPHPVPLNLLAVHSNHSAVKSGAEQRA